MGPSTPSTTRPCSPSGHEERLNRAGNRRGQGHRAIDKVCLDDPECYIQNFDTGAEWIAIAEAAVDGNIVQTYCGSPSGAFLD